MVLLTCATGQISKLTEIHILLLSQATQHLAVALHQDLITAVVVILKAMEALTKVLNLALALATEAVATITLILAIITGGINPGFKSTSTTQNGHLSFPRRPLK